MSISFRANPVATTVLQTQNQQNNALGLSENGQKVLNKTNVHANAYIIIQQYSILTEVVNLQVRITEIYY